MWQSFFFRFGEKRVLRGMSVAVWVLSSPDQRGLLFEKMESALRLIEKLAPDKFRALQRDVRSILVAGVPTFRGRYVQKLRMIELYHEYVLKVQTVPESLACTLIHEAQHARLFRLGFGYDEPIRERIEKLCIRAQRNFARLLPNGDDLVAEAEAWLAADLEPIFSNKSRRQADLRALRELARISHTAHGLRGAVPPTG